MLGNKLKILLGTLLVWPSILSGQGVDDVNLQEIKDQLIEESLNTVVEVRTLSLLNEEGELKQFSRFYSGRQFQSPYSQLNNESQESVRTEVKAPDVRSNRVAFTSSAIPLGIARKLPQSPNTQLNSEGQELAFLDGADTSACEITNNFRFLPRGFQANIGFDFSSKTQPGPHVLDSQQEQIIDEFTAAINRQVNESGMYLYRDTASNPFPYAQTRSPGGSAGVSSVLNIDIKLIEAQNEDGTFSDIIDVPVNFVGNAVGQYFGHDLNLMPLRRLKNVVKAQNNAEFSAEVRIAFYPNFLTEMQEVSERALFSGTTSELINLLIGLVTNQFEYYRESHRCEMEYFVAYQDAFDGMLIPVGRYSGVNNSSKFLLMPSRPSHEQILNEDYMNLIRLAEVVKVDQHFTALQVVDDAGFDITGYSVIPL